MDLFYKKLDNQVLHIIHGSCGVLPVPPTPMKTPVSPHMVVALVLSTIATLSAQNSASILRPLEFSDNAAGIAKRNKPSFTEGSALSSASVVQALVSAGPAFSEGQPPNAPQQASPQKVGSMGDHKVAVGAGAQPYEVEQNSLEAGLVRMASIHRESGKRTEDVAGVDCKAVSLSVEQRIKLDVSKVLQIVEAEVGANPSCACEIVKVSITACDADVAQVVAIVETAINAAPDSMRIISQCAIATMPESIAEVQALLAELDPNTGDADGYSSKSAKSAKSAKDGKDAEVASIVAPSFDNPLDRSFFPTFIPPPLITPPPVTDVNPGRRSF
jgi:hypothetical protein